MTHDELLAKIDSCFAEMPVDYGQSDAHKALRAIVKLSKTRGGVGMNDSFNNGWVTAMRTVYETIERELA